MSDDASPSSAARIDASFQSNGNESTTRLPSELHGPSRRRTHSPSRRRRKKKNRKRRNPGLAKKLEFVTHLLKSLDTLVFAELSALYYMECSMFRFIIRAVGQYMYLTPKDEVFPFLTPASRMHVMLIAVSNLICVLLHLFASLPSGPEYHRGYLHGGLVIDFVGQKPPGSRLYYILVDLAILAIQCLMLTVHTEREKLRATLKTFRPLVSGSTSETSSAPTIEDLDAEERGIPREMSGLSTTDDSNDIELRPLRRAGDDEDDNEGPGGTEPLLVRENSSEESTRSHLSDLLQSGNGILGEYHILHLIRSATMDVERTAAHSLRTLSYGATLAAIEARRQSATVSNRPLQTDRR